MIAGFQIRDLLFGGFYVTIAGLVFLTHFASLPLGAVALIAAIAAVGHHTAKRIERVYDQQAEVQERRDLISQHVRQFCDRSHEFGLSPADEETLTDRITDSSIEPVKKDVYDACVSISYGDLPDYRSNIIHVLLLCREIVKLDSAVEQAELKARVENLTTNFNLNEIDEPTTEFLGAYEVSRGVIEGRNSNPEQIFEHEPDDPQETALEFAVKFGTTQQLALVLFSDRERSRELRRTLGRLVARGKLNTETVNKETAERLQEELEQIGNEATKYLIFSQKVHYPEEVTQAIERFPHTRFGNKYPEQGFPEAVQYMRMYVVYPEHDYGSAERFLEEAIRPAIPEDTDDDGFLAVMPLELENMAIYPDDDVEDYLGGTYEALSFLKTGSSEDLSEVVSDKVMSEIGVSELLSTLPFNVIDPEIEEHEKEIIIENYEDLKTQFSIDELFDWADVDPDQLAEALSTLDDESDIERWTKVSESVVAQVREYTEAAYGDSSQSDLLNNSTSGTIR